MGFIGPAPLPSPRPGQVYRHYKGGIYVVMGIGMHTERGERLVVYNGDDGKIWCRPFSMFTGLVTPGGAYRFTRVMGS